MEIPTTLSGQLLSGLARNAISWVRLHLRDVLLLEDHLDEDSDEHGEEGEGDEVSRKYGYG